MHPISLRSFHVQEQNLISICMFSFKLEPFIKNLRKCPEKLKIIQFLLYNTV